MKTYLIVNSYTGDRVDEYHILQQAKEKAKALNEIEGFELYCVSECTYGNRCV
jgi:hypothetical protein